VTLAAASFFAAPSATAAQTGVATADRPDPIPAAPLADPKEMAPPELDPPPELGVRSGKVKLADPEEVAALAGTDSVALRPLVVAVDEEDFGLETWTSILDGVGTPYDVLLARDEQLTADDLVREDGSGKYSAILLTSNSLLYEDGPENWVSALDGAEWNILWEYERTFNVRQASLYTSYGTWPEDYCLRGGSEGEVGASPIEASGTLE